MSRAHVSYAIRHMFFIENQQVPLTWLPAVGVNNYKRSKILLLCIFYNLQKCYAYLRKRFNTGIAQLLLLGKERGNENQ